MVRRVFSILLIAVLSTTAPQINAPLRLPNAKAAEIRLPRVRWTAQLKDRSCARIEVLGNGNVVTSRGSYAYEVFSPTGESVLAYPPPRVEGEEPVGALFADDGRYYTITFHTIKNPNGKYYSDITAFSPAGEVLWTRDTPEGVRKETWMELNDTGILLMGMKRFMDDQVQRTVTTLYQLDRDGKLLKSIELEGTSERYYFHRVADDRLICADDGNLRCFNVDGSRAWEYTAYGVRREFQVFPDGCAYALIKAPERLIKVGADGQLAWECNISDHAAGQLNQFNEIGHAFGEYLDVAPDGTVYVCDAYNSLTAVSRDGEYLWSIPDPTTTQDSYSWILDYPSAPSVAPDGTIYLCSGAGGLLAVSPSGALLFVDERFAKASVPAAFSPDGTIYLESAGWLYALDPGEPAVSAQLAEQEAVREAEREREAKSELDWREEEQQLQAKLTELAEQAGRDPEELKEEYYGGWTPESEPAPPGLQIADRTVVAGEIIRGLLAYYADHGEWPPYLLGVKYPDDPLIAGGYLEAYPLAWPQPGCWCGLEAANTDDRQYVRWYCAVSTPGAPEAPVLETGRGGPDDNPRPRTRCLSIGPRVYDHSGYSFFGYQRGEWLGRTEQEAWLWFYGSNIWPERNNPIPWNASNWQAMEYYDLFRDFSEFGRLGFDLLNDETGELVPDGKRDGICLLYKLKDGKLAEVLRADGI